MLVIHQDADGSPGEALTLSFTEQSRVDRRRSAESRRNKLSLAEDSH